MEIVAKRKEKRIITRKTKVSGAEALMLSLLAEDVNTIFGYPGGAIMPVYDKLFDFENNKLIQHILSRHEQGAIHAAQGYARVTGKPGICFATSGPGASNVITGIADAFLDSTPVICFTGQVNSLLLGTDAFQEIDVIGLSMPVTKWNYQITNANEIPNAVAKAFYIAKSGRPGPVVIDITKDAMFGEVNFQYEKIKKIRSYIPVPSTSEIELKKAADLINCAKKPLALVGQGVLLGNAKDELMKFIEKTGIPVASTLLGLAAFPNNHPLYTGMLGMHGNIGPNVNTNKADLIIALGMRFDDRVTGKLNEYALGAKKIHFEIDKAEVNKNVQVDVAILGNLKNTLPEITSLVDTKQHTNWRESFRYFDEEESKYVWQDELYPENGKITMGEVIRHLDRVADDQTVLVTDVGQHQMMAARYFKFNKARSLITSGGLGTMGFGLPAAIGAQIGNPHKKVIAVIGDGGFQMTIQELGTLIQQKLPVKIVILNNSYLGMVRQWQELFFEERYASTEISAPDFVKVANAYGLNAEKVDKSQDLPEVVNRLWNAKGPYLIEVKVEKKGNVFPMIPVGAPVDKIIYKP